MRLRRKLRPVQLCPRRIYERRIDETRVASGRRNTLAFASRQKFVRLAALARRKNVDPSFFLPASQRIASSRRSSRPVEIQFTSVLINGSYICMIRP